MAANSYSFVKVTQLPKLVPNNETVSYLGDNSYMLISYDDKSYKISTKEFIDLINRNIISLNKKLDDFITYSNAYPRKQQIEGQDNVVYPEEKYIHTYYVTNTVHAEDDQTIAYLNSEDIDLTSKRFTILSYGIYSSLIKNEKSLDNNTYFTTYLDNGLVTGEVMNTYMTYSLDTLIGTPGTLAYITEAIDSISEFAAWFEGVKKDSSYNVLMSYIIDRDNAIISSYELADATLRHDIMTYVTEQDYEIKEDYISRYNELYNLYVNNSQYQDLLAALSTKQDKLISGSNIKTINGESVLGSGDLTIDTGVYYSGGTNISIDNDNNINCNIGIDNTNNSINVGDTKYTLGLDDSGKLSLKSFTFVPFSVTVSGGSSTSHEYNSNVPASSNITLSATATKTANWGNGWIATSPATVGQTTYSNNNLTATATGSYTAITKGTSTVEFTWTISATHNPTAEEQANGHSIENAPNNKIKVTHTFTKYKIFVFSATGQNINNISIEENTNSQPITIKYNNETVSNVVNNTYESKPSTMPTLTTPNSSSNRYIYLLIKQSWCNSSTPKIKWQSGDISASEYNTSSLNTYWKKNIKLYGNTTDYCLFVSTNNYPSNETFNITVS